MPSSTHARAADDDMSENSEDDSDVTSYKLAVVVRNDIVMTTGKLAAQVGHAVHDAVTRCKAEILESWEADGSMIVVLEERSEAGLRSVEATARTAGVAVHDVQDEGLTEVESGTWTALAVGPDNVDRIDSVTGRLRLLRDTREEELERLRISLREAEAEIARLRLHQEGVLPTLTMQTLAVPRPTGTMVLKEGEAWVALDLGSGRSSVAPVVPELFEQWCWEGDTSVLPYKWQQVVEECCGGDVVDCGARPWDEQGFDSQGTFFITSRSDTCGVAVVLPMRAPPTGIGLLAFIGVRPEFRRKGLGLCLLRLCLQRHLELGRTLIFCAIDTKRSSAAWRLLEREGFRWSDGPMGV